jgi:hypothetical protein
MSSIDDGRDAPGAWADEAALSRLHRALAREDTPAQLDAAVLAAARRHAASGPRLVTGNSDATLPASEADLSRLHASLAPLDTDFALDESIIAGARQPRSIATQSERAHDDTLGGVHRAYSTEDTAPDLDRKVLELAALRGRTQRAGANLRRYRIPLALAAALVLGLALTRMTALFLPDQPGPRVDLLGGSSQRAPQPWLEDIRELARTQRVDEARHELQRFSARYPDHPIPDDLATLLPARPGAAPNGR